MRLVLHKGLAEGAVQRLVLLACVGLNANFPVSHGKGTSLKGRVTRLRDLLLSICRLLDPFGLRLLDLLLAFTNGGV